MKFEVGARVIATKGWDGNDEIIGVPGTVVVLKGGNIAGIEFDDPVGGHSLNGLLSVSGCGWYTSTDVLEAYKGQEVDFASLAMSYDALMA